MSDAAPTGGADTPGGADTAGATGTAGPAGTAGPRRPIATTVTSSVARGGLRLLWWWPGVVVVIVAYAAVAIGLYDHSYSNLWGGLAAAVVAAAWYGSPVRRIEARRRARLRASRTPPETASV